MEFLNEYDVFAAGEGGIVLRSFDQGATWREDTWFASTVRDFFFVDSRIGWAVGDAGLIMHTRNGGQTWSPQISTTTSSLSAIDFRDPLHGLVVGSSGTILRTGNGGVSWELMRSEPQTYLSDVLIIDSRKAWAVGTSYIRAPGDEILTTSDGGRSWELIDAGVPTDLGYEEGYPDWVSASLRSIAAFDDSTIVIVGDAVQGLLQGGIRIRTGDGGLSWDVDLTNFGHHDIQPFNKESGMIVGMGGTALKTTDRGLNWTRVGKTEGWELYSVSFANPSSACAVGLGGIIHQIQGEGQDWQRVSSGSMSPVMDVCFNSAGYGFVVGFDGLLMTADKGKTWSHTGCYAGQAIDFVNELTGWACDYSGNMYKTIDGGFSWGKVAGNIAPRVYDLDFTDSLNGWAAGMPYILHTSDGGNTWNIQHNADGFLWGITFLDSLCGWAVGRGGVILHTNNGGATWIRQSSPTTAQFNDVYFIDSLRGWAVAGTLDIVSTVDGGDTWSLHSAPDVGRQGLYSVAFVDSLNGWAVGTNGLVLGTSDGGESWKRQITPVSAHLQSIWATDSATAWAAGWLGTIIHLGE